MPVNDPVGDMLTRIRNASRARHDKVVMPTSKQKVAIARVLREAGYIADYTEHELQPQGEITLQLKYGPDKSPVITGIRRISNPLHQPGHPQRRRRPEEEHRRRADLHGVLT
jgi:small subunit ribosomal protein S8